MGRVGKKAVLPVWLRVLIILEMMGVAVAAFTYLPPARQFASPEWARMIVFHVPCAMVAVLAYMVSTVYAVAYLLRRDFANDTKSAASAWLGFIFTVLATLTGMVFARIQWGTAWNWDPRETSILMLLVVYAAYFALRGGIANRNARARISAAYNVLACLVMPFFVFILPRLSEGLHPNRAHLSPEYRMVLGASMLGYTLIYVWFFGLSVRGREAAIAGKGK